MSAFAKVDEVKRGSFLIADGGFTCMEPGRKKVMANAEGDLYVRCREGRHYLDGQIDENGVYVGLTLTSRRR